MRPVAVIDAPAVALLRPNIDTDVVIRIDRLVGCRPDELGPFLFEAWRYLDDGRPDPAFPLNQERAAGARILVAGPNFGCGSSREHAVWALQAFGFDAVIAPSFGDIFRQNCFQNGLLPVSLPGEEVELIAGEIDAAGHASMRVDLAANVVVTPAGRRLRFELEEDRRAALLAGLDDIGVTQQHEEEIVAFERHAEQLRPWSSPRRLARLLLLAGDGVGQEVMPQVRRVVEWFVQRGRIAVDLDEQLFGLAAWRQHGSLMPERTWAAVEEADAILFGAIGGPGYEELPAEARSVDWLLEMRRRLDLYTNLRPVRAHPALADASPLRPEIADGVDLVIVRELVGGVYFGEPRGIETLGDGGRRAVNTTVYTTAEIERIACEAFELARRRRGRVCSVDKANVLEVGALWRETVQRLRDAEYPDVELTHLHVDNCAMQLVRAPRQFDVVLTENLFGDILSDEAAMIAGSLGMVPSASLGPRRADGTRPALYEPVHGSAPDIAGQQVVNPLAAILSFGLCLRHSLQRPEESDRLDAAVGRALAGGTRTADLLPAGGTPATTAEMADAVLAELDRS